jgi:uncharacterized protein
VNWRRLNNVLHRDIGYLAVGLTLVYGVSGLAVNHKADWNPNYRVEKSVLHISPVTAEDKDTIVRDVLGQLKLAEQPRNSFRPDPQTLRLFFKEQTYSVDLPTGTVVVERTHHRPVLFEANQLHLNTPRGLWTWIADVYAAGLILLAITGMFVLKGKTGITGRGAWLTAIGVLVPVGYWLLR